MATGLFNLKQVNQAISQGAWSGYIAPKWVEYLVVAGGGGAAINRGGGGGAGGLLTGIVTVTTGTSYTVTVGAGGAAKSVDGQGNNGAASVFGSISTTGGGGGGNNTGTIGTAGGSGGGSGNSGTTYGGAGVAGQGNAGGGGFYLASNYGGGGGGGAGTIGGTGTGSLPGNGGAGIASAISGVVATYAGGGGGAGYALPGAGGVGGGGYGVTGANGGNGTANTGGGGGASTGGPSGSGGSGVVIVRYPGNVQFYTGGAITYANGYIVHTFVASGTLAPTTPAVVASDYQISRSLRFNSADSTYLNRTPASASNQKTWTWSGWVKLSAFSADKDLFSADSTGGARYTGIRYTGGDALDFVFDDAAAQRIRSSAVYRDPSAWYHIVAAMDTTQATASNRMKLYVNGVQITAFAVESYPSQNADSDVNSTRAHNLGRRAEDSAAYLNGYMTEVNFIDGQALTPSSFGATNANTGVWGPKAYTGTYGTNGFYLNFSDNSNTTAATLGADYSGNGNNWTPNNFSVTAGAGNDSLVDSPTNYGTDYGVGGAVRGNYATLNPLRFGTLTRTFSNGNLDLAVTSSANFSATATIGVSSGKWYWEVTATLVTSSRFIVGVADSSWPGSDLGDSAYSYGYIADARKYNNGTASAYGATYTTNDILGIALDMDAGTLTFYKNGTSQGQAFSGITQQMFPAIGSTGGTSAESCTFNFGQRAFAYTPPAGYQALVTQNLPVPTIGTSPTTLANLYFTPVTYTGTGAARSVTVGFQPDFVWIKDRTSAEWHRLYDAVRGATKELFSNTTNAEGTDANGLTAFDSNGFSVGTLNAVNKSADALVAWNWKANGSGSTNTAGSITSTVSANTTSGFSVVTYTGTGSLATVGHGLGVAPSMVIVKSRNNVVDWVVYHSALGINYSISLNSTASAVNTTSYWNSSAPTSTTFGVNVYGGNNASGYTYVAYCFAEISGYSKFGSYTGNFDTNGPFVFTGFRPAYVLIKATSINSNNWFVYDSTRSTYNLTQQPLLANASDTELNSSNYGIDLLSNGFKIRAIDSNINTNNATYIYMALASNPFKYSLAR